MTAPRRFEYTDAKSNKFWEVTVAGREVTVRYGRIGTTGQGQVTEHKSDKEASASAEKSIAEKVRKGYREVGGATPTSPTATKPPTQKRRSAWKIEPVEVKSVHETSVQEKTGPLGFELELTKAECYRWGYIIVSKDPRSTISKLHASGDAVDIDTFDVVHHEFSDGVSGDAVLEMVGQPDDIDEDLAEALSEHILGLEQTLLDHLGEEDAGWRVASGTTEFVGALTVTEVSDRPPYDALPDGAGSTEMRPASAE